MTCSQLGEEKNFTFTRLSVLTLLYLRYLSLIGVKWSGEALPELIKLGDTAPGN